MFKVGDKFIRTADSAHTDRRIVAGYIGTVKKVFPTSIVCDGWYGHGLDCIRKVELEDLLAAAESEVKSLREQIKQRDARPPEVGDIVTYGSGVYEFKVMAVDGSRVWLKTVLETYSSRNGHGYITKNYKEETNFKVIKREDK